MEQRDLIKDQIEQFGRALASVLSGFLGLKAQGNIQQGLDVSNEALKNQLDLDVDVLLELNPSDLNGYFEKKNMAADQIEVLADYLYEYGLFMFDKDASMAHNILKRTLDLIGIVNDRTENYSMDRNNKQSKVLALIQKLTR